MEFVSKVFRRRSYNTINGSQLQNLLDNNNNVVILDVRNPGEYRRGHIPNAINIPLGDIIARLGEISPYKTNIIVVYCASGGLSSKASYFLSKNGYKQVYNLNGGISSYKGKLSK